jgi:hypothetical protein
MPRIQLDMGEIINIARRTRDQDLLNMYTSNNPKCKYCNEQWRVVKNKVVIPKNICGDECVENAVVSLAQYKSGFIERIATEFAKKNNLPNGQTIHYLDDTFRNHNLLFWDALNQRIVYPFLEYDDDGSVPPIFPVGNGYFNPTDWLDEVEHNSTVFPSITLIREMKEFVAEHPKEKKMIVTINGKEYDVIYNPKEMTGKWDSPILNVEPARTPWGEELHDGNDRLHVSPGNPVWRKNIDEETDSNIRAKDAALLEMTAKYGGPENIVEAEINRHKGSKRGGRKTRRRNRGN